MKAIFILSILFLSLQGFTQLEPVDVADLTLKVGAVDEKELYYGFAEGDEIIFSFEERKGKALKELEIIELPTNTKFMDFKTKNVTEKKIKVRKTGVYKFAFRNTSLGGRICAVKIQRIPSSEDLIDFNTDWKWKTVYDTTHVPYIEDSLVGYDTLKYKEVVREVVKTDTIADMVFDKNQRVHSYFNENLSRTFLKVDLPRNESTEFNQIKTFAWAYWIGVGEEGQKAYSKNVSSLGNVGSKAATYLINPLAGLAMSALTVLVTPTLGDDVAYAFLTDNNNAHNYVASREYYYFDHGKGKAAYGKRTDRLTGTFYMGFYNDNNTRGIDVNVKITVLREVKIYEDIVYDREKVTPRYVQLNKIKHIVESKKIRVNAG